MMTRGEVFKKIREAKTMYRPGQPGKFEGENLATVYYYLSTLDGYGDFRGVEGELYAIVDVDPTERKILELPKDTVAYTIYENGSGFVYGEAMNKKRLEQFEKEMDKLESEDGE